jgi:hypothetical protein
VLDGWVFLLRLVGWEWALLSGCAGGTELLDKGTAKWNLRVPKTLNSTCNNATTEGRPVGRTGTAKGGGSSEPKHVKD